MSPAKVVLDTNVLISGFRSRRGASFRLLTLADDPRWQLLLSATLLFEYEAVARRQAAQFWAKPEKIEDVLDYLCAIAVKPTITYSWRPFLSDPDDDMLLELAVAGGATHIVTHNCADFRGAKQFGIAIITPKDFLRDLGDHP
jgi:putative PIN family toxin of toxin-antitoxin system